MRHPRFLTILEWVRIPNVVAAPADVIAGASAVGFFEGEWTADRCVRLGLLCVASMHLYAGGIVLNDLFDASADATFRPHRPIPSGRIPRETAVRIAVALLLAGICLALAVSRQTGTVAMALVTCIVLYDGPFKTTPLAPWMMGLCRAVNLLMGGTLGGIESSASGRLFLPALCIGLYVAALTVFARKETQSGHRLRLRIGLGGMMASAAAVLLIEGRSSSGAQAVSVLVLLGLILLLARAGSAAVRDARPANIQRAAGMGIVGVTVLDVAVALRTAGSDAAMVVATLMFASLLLGRRFPRT